MNLEFAKTQFPSALHSRLQSVFRVAVIAAFAGGILGCADHPPMADGYKHTWKGVCYSSFGNDVTELVGPDALDCGMVRFEDGAQTQARKQRCARLAVESGRAFKFGYIGLGDDSLFCDVAGRSKDGQLWSFFVDYDVTGQYGSDGSNSALWIQRCERIDFEPGTIYAGSFFKLSECRMNPETVKRLLQ